LGDWELTSLLDTCTAEYEAVRPRQRREPAWLGTRRAGAMDRFQALGFPTTRDEEWRFTSVAPIANTGFVRPPDPVILPHRQAIDPFRLRGALAEVVFVDGRHVPELSHTDALPAGVRVEPLAAALAADPDALEEYLARLASFERQAFTALNTALFADGLVLRVPAATVLAAPIHLLFVSSASGHEPVMTHPRVLAMIGENSQAALVESYAGPPDGRYFTNAVTEIALADHALTEHYKLQREGSGASHVGAMHVRIGRNAHFTSHSVSLGGMLARNDVAILLDGEGAECTLNGLYAGGGVQLLDNHTTIDHARPHCSSRELYKGILADRARGVFNGRIVVRAGAEKTDARQTNRALLLSAEAQVNTNPQLEIFASDVRCTHGAAIGQLDDEAVFYLRSRGLGEAEAKALLVRAFADDVLGRMRLDAARTGVQADLVALLARALPAAGGNGGRQPPREGFGPPDGISE
jgi:Fe-S cluster assembly protein SufD